MVAFPISILKNLHETVSMVIAIDISESASCGEETPAS